MVGFSDNDSYTLQYGVRVERAIYHVCDHTAAMTPYFFAHNTMDLKFKKQQELQSKLFGIERFLHTKNLQIISIKQYQEQRNIIIEQLTELGITFNKSRHFDDIIYVTHDYVSPKSISGK